MQLYLLLASLLLVGAQDEDPLTVDDILALKGKYTEEEILKAVASQGVRIPEDIDLRARLKGLSEDFILRVQKEGVLGEVLRWLKGGVAEKEILHRLGQRGASFRLEAREEIRLKRAGASDKVIHAFQGTLAQVPVEGYIRFEHPGGLYHIQVPEGWQVTREVVSEGVLYRFTPPQTAAGSTANVFTLALALPVSQSLDTERSLEKMNQQFLASLKQQGDLKLMGTRPTRLGGIPAMINGFRGTSGQTEMLQRTWFAYHDDVIYIVGAVASKAEFEKRNALFDEIVGTFDPYAGRSPHVRKETANPQTVVSQYKEAVVRVINSELGGMGTGFFVRSDGYLLTNHHVVDNGKGGIVSTVKIQWDSTLKREPLEGQVIAAVRSADPMIDVALVKVPGEQYKAFPLTRIISSGRPVREQDKVLALGYPGVTDQAKQMANPLDTHLTLTTTEGALARIAFRDDGTLDYAFHTASIQHGNSGGPCFDLETHSVIGINTFFSWDPDAMRQGVQLGAAGYNGIVSIDAALEHFPEIATYPLNADDVLSADDFAELGAQFLNQGRIEPAIRQFQKALQRKDGHIEALSLLAKAYAQAGNPTEAALWAEKALKLDPKNISALLALARIYAEGETALSLRHLNRLLEIDPNHMEALLLRAELHRATEAYAEALEDAARVNKMLAGNSADALISMGTTYYAAKEYDEGRDMFLAATRVEPESVEAQLGIAEYWERTGELKRAGVAYEEVANKFPDQPLAASTAAEFYFTWATELEAQKNLEQAKGLYSKSCPYYQKACLGFAKRHQVPSKLLLYHCAQALVRGPADLANAETIYAVLSQQLIEIGLNQERRDFDRANDPLLQQVYFELVSLYGGMEGRAAARCGLWRAGIFLNESSEIANSLKSLQPQIAEARLSSEELQLLLQLQYSPGVLGDIIQHTELGFQVTKEFLGHLAKKGVHPYVLVALALKAQGSAPQPQAPKQPPPAPDPGEKPPTPKPDPKPAVRDPSEDFKSLFLSSEDRAMKGMKLDADNRRGKVDEQDSKQFGMMLRGSATWIHRTSTGKQVAALIDSRATFSTEEGALEFLDQQIPGQGTEKEIPDLGKKCRVWKMKKQEGKFGEAKTTFCWVGVCTGTTVAYFEYHQFAEVDIERFTEDILRAVLYRLGRFGK